MKRKLLFLVLKSWIVGLLFCGFFVLPLMTLIKGELSLNLGDQFTQRIFMFFSVYPSSLLMTFTFGLVLSFPLFLIALVSVLSLGEIVVKHRSILIVFAPVSTAVLVAFINAITRNNDWAKSHTLVEKFWQMLLAWETMIFVFPVLVAATYFYYSMSKIECLKSE